jgi:hypothetical protein
MDKTPHRNLFELNSAKHCSYLLADYGLMLLTTIGRQARAILAAATLVFHLGQTIREKHFTGGEG